MNSCPGVRSAFCIPKECQPSVTGPTAGRYDSASPQAASEASATQSSKASDYPPTTSDSTISSLLALISKFFSPFLRSTCSLSVSHKYLALEEVYLPFRAAVPNSPTLGGLLLRQALVAYGAVTLCGVLFQGTHTRRPMPSHRLSRLQFRTTLSRQISTLSFCLFSRRYCGNPF
jgi:hypothetical protein